MDYDTGVRTTRLTHNKLLAVIQLCSATSIFFFGYDQGVMGGVNETPDYIRRMKVGNADGTVVTDSTKLGGIVAIYYLGTLVGCLMGGPFSDRYGRKKTVVVGCCWAFVGAILMTCAMNSSWMLCARIIAGIGTGHLNVAVPVWSAETAPFESRGRFLGVQFMLNVGGVVVAYWLEYGLSFTGDNSFRWRFPLAFQILPLIPLAIGINFLPESPRFLIKRGRTEAARYVLARLRTKDVNEDDPVVVKEMEEISAQLEVESHAMRSISYPQLLLGIGSKNLHLTRRAYLSIGLVTMQLWGGIFAVSIYGPIIFKEAGFSTQNSLLISGINNVIYMFSTLIAAWLVDRLGRRRTLIAGACLQGVCMFLAGGFSKLAADTSGSQQQRYGSAAVFFIILYNAAFGASWLLIPWLYPSEIYPLPIRAKGMALGVVGWSIGCGMCSFVIPIQFAAWAEKTLYFFGALNVAWILAVYALFPETAKKTLEEMDLLFAQHWYAPQGEKDFRRLRDSTDNLAAVTQNNLGMDDFLGEKPGLHVEPAVSHHESA